MAASSISSVSYTCTRPLPSSRKVKGSKEASPWRHVRGGLIQAKQATDSANVRLPAPSLPLERRALLAFSVLLAQPGIHSAWPDAACAGEEGPEAAARLYQDSKNKFSLALPAAFEQQEKAGATALFIDPDRKSTKIGVTVNPVRVASLSQFGSLQDVGDKLLGAERAKESTLDCTLLYQQERTSGPDVTFYEYGYELYNTRGRKRIQTSVTINKSKLYILNAEVKCEKETCDGFEDIVSTLKTVVTSFAVQ